MSKASIYNDEINGVLINAERDMEELRGKLSELDKNQSIILHIIEEESFNASRGYCLCKEIKDIREARRVVKNEMRLLNIFISNVSKYMYNGTRKIKSREEKLKNSIYKHRSYKGNNIIV